MKMSLLADARVLTALCVSSLSLGFACSFVGCDMMARAPLPSYADDAPEDDEGEAEDEDDEPTGEMRDAGKSDAGSKDAAVKDAATGDAGKRDAGTKDAGKASVSLYCKAQAVLNTHCTACHDGEGSAGTSMGLTTYDELSAPSPGDEDKPVWEVVGTRVHDAKKPMPPKGLLKAAQVKDLDDWIAAGAPEGGGC